jgi:hypothetical protein
MGHQLSLSNWKLMKNFALLTYCFIYYTNYLNKSCTFFEDTIRNFRTLVSPPLQIRSSSMLLIMIVGKWKKYKVWVASNDMFFCVVLWWQSHCDDLISHPNSKHYCMSKILLTMSESILGRNGFSATQLKSERRGKTARYKTNKVKVKVYLYKQCECLNFTVE